MEEKNNSSIVKQVRKRDGRIVEFTREKIANAIFKAATSVGGKDKDAAELLADKVETVLEYQFTGKETPTVEEIQDIVEKVLIKNGHASTAKAYILYRSQRKKARETKSVVLDVNNTISSYMGKTDWKVKENSNEQFSFSGLLLYTAGNVIKNYMLNEIYPQNISEAHRKGEIHIHDITHGVIGYCAGWSLKNLLLKGFGGVPNKVDCKPAKHLSTVVHQMVNYIGCLQMEFAGAQAFSSVDTLLAPFVKSEELIFKEVKQAMQQLVFSLNIPSRWGSQYPFSNLTFDWVVPKDMEHEPAIVGGKPQQFNYGDCQKEMDMINKAFLEVMVEGDANGRIFTFPIPTYNLTKDFNWDSENSELLFEVTAKYGTPYFQNYIGSNLDPGAIRAMCCRLNMDTRELMNRPGSMWGPGDNTGSLGVVTMNMNRLGYEAKTKEEFLKKLGYLMELGKESLEIKREIVNKNLEHGLMPYTKIYLGGFHNHFSTIGLCGMHECCLNFVGKGIESEEGREFTKEVLNFMRKKLKTFQAETGNLYNLEATPAESTSYRFAKLDKELYPEILTSGKDVPFLTNSTQLPVDLGNNLVEALEHQNEIQPLYTGGTIFHTFIGEKLRDSDTAKRIIKKIVYNTRLPYFSLTPTFSICPDHGYLTGEQFKCNETVVDEKTGEEKKCGHDCEVHTRIVGYYRPVQNWNVGKREEYNHRVTFCQKKAIETPYVSPITKAAQK